MEYKNTMFNGSDVTIVMLVILQMVTVFTILNHSFHNCPCMNADTMLDEIQLTSSQNLFIFGKDENDRSASNSASIIQKVPSNEALNKQGPSITNPIVRSSGSNSNQTQNISNSKGKCKSLKLIIVVFSEPGNSDVRLAIRGTWGAAALRQDTDLVFLMGSTYDAVLQKELVKENYLYGDLVQADFIDSPRNLTLKSIALLHWVHAFCKDAEFILKVDDNNFVNVPNILDFLNETRNEKRVIFGKKCRNESHQKSKNDGADSDFLCDLQYPEFVATSAFVISQYAIEDLLNAAIIMDRFPMEDAFITGVCAEYCNISKIDDARFKVTTNENNPCSFRNIFATVLPGISNYVAWWYANNESHLLCN